MNPKKNLKLNKLKGFTLAEVLITLAVIGAIAIMVVPTIHSQTKWAQMSAQTRKAQSVLNQALLKYSALNTNFIECGYWKKNPYGGGGTCKGYDSKGNCTGWVFKNTGEKLPADYNGRFTDCKDVYASFIQNMNVRKECLSNALANGCISEDFKGIDDIYRGKQDGDVADVDANKATAGVSGFRTASIRAGKAFVTGDGMIFVPYSGFSMPIILVDVNGDKRPNKWGHDIHSFILKIPDAKSNPSFLPYMTSMTYVEKGGRTTYHVLYGRTNDR